MSEVIYVDEFVEMHNVKTFIDCADENEIAKIIKYCKKKQRQYREANKYGGVGDYVYEMSDEEAGEFIKYLKHYKPYLFEKDENERLFA
ncbi:hypothetical protein CFTD6783_02275 [Campylobacter fetus subsp. testudinum]|uniref:hypothetical protein n=1 Tax=Campylobacter fetus TaxID=196 RepID=UPI00081876E7|nr:hypothetical protein [Campylobacter fetus]OCS10385.1 hypothetical protein CFTD6783_02275 [Campylobacter fetus subsp. testudinum]